jgi:hypothetical protein
MAQNAGFGTTGPANVRDDFSLIWIFPGGRWSPARTLYARGDFRIGPAKVSSHHRLAGFDAVTDSPVDNTPS